MTLVTDILKQMPGVSQPQRKFLATLFITILAVRGRINFRNLSRYCAYSERRENGGRCMVIQVIENLATCSA